MFCSFFQKSDFSNCVIAEEESDFTGEWLKHKTPISSGVKKTEECIALDFEIDNGDGNKNGKVRWAECLHGPDGDETGRWQGNINRTSIKEDRHDKHWTGSGMV